MDLAQEDTAKEEADLLRTEAVEALLNLMNTAMDLVGYRREQHAHAQYVAVGFDSVQRRVRSACLEGSLASGTACGSQHVRDGHCLYVRARPSAHTDY